MPTSSTSERRVAVVTGASKGLGRGIAVALAGSGCDVVVSFATDEVGAKETAAQAEAAGATTAVVGGDVRDAATADALVGAAQDLGGLDVWVNNAGVSVLAPVVETDPDDLARMIDVNLVGTFHGLRAAAGHMRDSGAGGRIVNVASEVAVQAFPLLGAYAATKFAVVGLTQAAALELAADGITVNAVGPGTAETDMVLAERRSEVALTGREPEAVRASYLDGIPAGRFCEPSDAGALVAWLAGAGASYVTGQTFLVNGGSVLH
jgi:meso-butanediol dehydrogenase / (S,S)-butanediol dehydrogenase / diacetyl reductase